jgi:hypothetical protein
MDSLAYLIYARPYHRSLGCRQRVGVSLLALLVGDRSGEFPGMPMRHTVHFVLVKPGHGTGAEEGSSDDRSITYDGHPFRIVLSKRKDSADAGARRAINV